MRKQYWVMLFILFGSSLAAANVIYVDCNGQNDPGSGTPEDPFQRIQAGLDAAVAGDTVQIGPGIYTGTGNYDLDPNGKSILICSNDPNDQNVTAGTIIDPGLSGRGFNFHEGEDTNCIVSGLTIKNAYTSDIGAAIYCHNSNPTVTNCVLKNNHAETYNAAGGAIACEESNSLFQNCIISNNFGYDGGGVECWSGSPTLVNCIISNNHAARFGGGIDCYNALYKSNPSLVNCDLINNTAEPNGLGAGGAISLWGSNANIKNSILWANDANTVTQLYLQFKSSITVSYCDVQGGISDVCTQDSEVNWDTGNIDSDPCFASFDPNGDPNLWDFHLKSEAGHWDPAARAAIDLTGDGFIDLLDFSSFASSWYEEGEGLKADFDKNNVVDFIDLQIMLQRYLNDTYKGIWLQDTTTSPCIDAGDPNSDWSAEPLPNGNRINMGAYGGSSEASKSNSHSNGNIADLNADGTVDFIDFAQLAQFWDENITGIEDLDGNGTVDIGDLDILATNWLWEKQ